MKPTVLLPAFAASSVFAASDSTVLAQINNNTLKDPCALLTATALREGWSPNNSKPLLPSLIGAMTDARQPISL